MHNTSFLECSMKFFVRPQYTSFFPLFWLFQMSYRVFLDKQIYGTVNLHDSKQQNCVFNQYMPACYFQALHRVDKSKLDIVAFPHNSEVNVMEFSCKSTTRKCHKYFFPTNESLDGSILWNTKGSDDHTSVFFVNLPTHSSVLRDHLQFSFSTLVRSWASIVIKPRKCLTTFHDPMFHRYFEKQSRFNFLCLHVLPFPDNSTSSKSTCLDQRLQQQTPYAVTNYGKVLSLKLRGFSSEQQNCKVGTLMIRRAMDKSVDLSFLYSVNITAKMLKLDDGSFIVYLPGYDRGSEISLQGHKSQGGKSFST